MRLLYLGTGTEYMKGLHCASTIVAGDGDRLVARLIVEVLRARYKEEAREEEPKRTPHSVEVVNCCRSPEGHRVMLGEGDFQIARMPECNYQSEGLTLSRWNLPVGSR